MKELNKEVNEEIIIENLIEQYNINIISLNMIQEEKKKEKGHLTNRYLRLMKEERALQKINCELKNMLLANEVEEIEFDLS